MNFLFNLVKEQALFAIVPELILILCLLISLLGRGFFNKSKNKNIKGLIALPFLGFAFIYCLSLLTQFQPADQFYYFAGSFVLNYFTLLLKALMLFVLIYLSFSSQKFRSDFYFLLFGAALGALVMVSSNDFILLFVALELLALSSIAMIAFDRANPVSTESALKYLLSSSMASAFLIFGISLIYGVALSADLNNASATFGREIINTHFIIGSSIESFPFFAFHLATLLFGVVFAFKLGLFPFHNWAPDVYQGANLQTTAFLTTISKIAAIGLVLRLIWSLFFTTSIPFIDPNTPIGQPLLSAVNSPAGFLLFLLAIFAFFSMWFGNFLGMRQAFLDAGKVSIKRILAYSSIAQTGYIVAILCLNPAFGLKQAIFFLIIYNLINLGVFLGLIRLSEYHELLQIKSIDPDSVKSLKGLVKYRPWTASYLSICLAALAGILPIILIPKMIITNSLFSAGLSGVFFGGVKAVSLLHPIMSIILLITLVLSSILGIVFYAYLIKNILVDQPEEEIELAIPASRTAIQPSWHFRTLATLLILLSVYISFNPAIWLDGIATQAAKSAINTQNKTN